MNTSTGLDDARLTAAVAMLGRTGVKEFRIGYSDPEDGDPIVWYAVATWARKAEASAALTPLEAVHRLCERVVDGAVCAHCGKMTIFDPDLPTDDPVEFILDLIGCRYQYDPELRTYRRSCEGDAP